MAFCKQSVLHAERFKESLVMTLHVLETEMKRLQTNKVKPPVNPFMIDSLIKEGIDEQSADTIVEIFITKTYSAWDRVHFREKKVILDIIPNLFNPEEIKPMFRKLAIKNINAMAEYLDKRASTADDSFEDEVWDCLDKMIEHSVLYVHYRRVPLPEAEWNRTGKVQKYLKTYQKDMKILPFVEKFKIKLVWPSVMPKIVAVDEVKTIEEAKTVEKEIVDDVKPDVDADI